MACQCQLIQAGHWELLTDVLSDEQLESLGEAVDSTKAKRPALLKKSGLHKRKSSSSINARHRKRPTHSNSHTSNNISSTPSPSPPSPPSPSQQPLQIQRPSQDQQSHPCPHPSPPSSPSRPETDPPVQQSRARKTLKNIEENVMFLRANKELWMSTPSIFTEFNSMSLQGILTVQHSRTPSDEVLNKLAVAFTYAHGLGLSCPMFKTVLAYFVQQKYPNKRLENDENVRKLRRYGRVAYNHVQAASEHVSVLLIMPQNSWAKTSNEYARIRTDEMMQLDEFVYYINEFEPLAKALLEHLEEVVRLPLRGGSTPLLEQPVGTPRRSASLESESSMDVESTSSHHVRNADSSSTTEQILGALQAGQDPRQYPFIASADLTAPTSLIEGMLSLRDPTLASSPCYNDHMDLINPFNL